MPLLPPSDYFPPAEDADAEGLIGFGGKLSPEWLLDAYRHGIFPWPISDFQAPVAWWSPDPRAVIEFDRFHVSRRLRRTCRGAKFEVTRDLDFAGVIRGCAMARASQSDLADLRNDRSLHPPAHPRPCP
jgi:leucyl/phenylalanyl-tRNA--protein transferase